MKWVVGIAFGVAGYAVLLIAWLLVPGTGPVPRPLCLVPLLALFALAAAGAVAQSRAPLRRPGRVVLAAGAALGTVLFAALIATVALPQSPSPGPGAPEDLGGGYVSNNHGTYTTLSDDEYRIAAKSWERGFLWTGGLLCLAGALGAGMQGERRAYDETRRDPKRGRPTVPEIRLRRR